MRYFSDVGIKGPVRTGAAPWVIDVLSSPKSSTPIGLAYCCAYSKSDLACWLIRISVKTIPGLWHLIDGEFVPIQ